MNDSTLSDRRPSGTREPFQVFRRGATEKAQDVGPRRNQTVCQSDLLRGRVITISAGTRNALHYHTGLDTFRMLLSGRLRIHGAVDDEVVELQPGDGVLTPQGASYRFECASPEPAQFLEICAFDPRTPDRRIEVA